LRQVSCGDAHAGVLDVVVDLVVDDAQGLAELGWGWWLVGGQQGAEQPVVELGVEDRHPEAVTGEHLAVAVLDPPD
jgi:hypothetical protein